MFAHYGVRPGAFAASAAINGAEVFRSRSNGRDWSGPHSIDLKVEVDGTLSEGGRSVLRLASGKILLVSHRASRALRLQGSHGIPAISESLDNGQTWRDFRILTDEPEDYVYVMNQRLVQMRSGRLLLPASVRRASRSREADYREGTHPTAGFCYISDDEGASWRRSKSVVLQDTDRGVQEPAVAERALGRLLMLFRSGRGSHQACYSEDGGDTWSFPQDTSLEAACSPLCLRRLPDDRLLIVYNHATPFSSESYFPRNPLVYALSKDGFHWSQPYLMDNQPGQQLIYPSATPISEGVLVVYSAHYASDAGQFDAPEDAWRTGGGKCCILAL